MTDAEIKEFEAFEKRLDDYLEKKRKENLSNLEIVLNALENKLNEHEWQLKYILQEVRTAFLK